MRDLAALPLLLILGASAAAASGASTAAVSAPPAVEESGSTGRHLPISLGFYGHSLVHPGARLATELTLAHGGGHRLFVEPALVGYLHRGHSLGLMAEGLIGYRHTFGFGLRLEALLGIGYLHTWADGTVYAVDGSGGLSEVTNLGRSSALGSALVGVGWDFAGVGAPVALFLRPRVTFLAPYNQDIRPGLAAEVGFTWRLPL